MAENNDVKKEISGIENYFHRQRVLNQVALETNFTYAIPNKYKFLGVKKCIKVARLGMSKADKWEYSQA